MAAEYLGLPFDIHTSGQDLTFPHNENENAICESLSGKPMARYWLHAGMVLSAGKKMSRSSGTALTLRDLLGRGYTGSQVRYCLLQTHYRRPAEFSLEKLDAACKELARLNGLIKNLRQIGRSGGPHKAVDDLVARANHDFFGALRDDLNVPKARARLFDLLRRLNEKVRTASFSQCDAQLAMDFLYRADRVLGVLDFDVPIPLGDEISLLIEERDQAREARDFARADELRKELESLGVTIEDTPGGSRVHRGA
jgi:cysteinyl-tRNA synthetase